MVEEMTIYDAMALESKNYDAIMKVWDENRSLTLMQALVEWAKRNGREIHIIDSKSG
jgi:hypothetical protein